MPDPEYPPGSLAADAEWFRQALANLGRAMLGTPTRRVLRRLGRVAGRRWLSA